MAVTRSQTERDRNAALPNPMQDPNDQPIPFQDQEQVQEEDNETSSLTSTAYTGISRPPSPFIRPRFNIELYRAGSLSPHSSQSSIHELYSPPSSPPPFLIQSSTSNSNNNNKQSPPFNSSPFHVRSPLHKPSPASRPHLTTSQHRSLRASSEPIFAAVMEDKGRYQRDQRQAGRERVKESEEQGYTGQVDWVQRTGGGYAQPKQYGKKAAERRAVRESKGMGGASSGREEVDEEEESEEEEEEIEEPRDAGGADDEPSRSSTPRLTLTQPSDDSLFNNPLTYPPSQQRLPIIQDDDLLRAPPKPVSKRSKRKNRNPNPTIYMSTNSDCDVIVNPKASSNAEAGPSRSGPVPGLKPAPLGLDPPPGRWLSSPNKPAHRERFNPLRPIEGGAAGGEDGDGARALPFGMPPVKPRSPNIDSSPSPAMHPFKPFQSPAGKLYHKGFGNLDPDPLGWLSARAKPDPPPREPADDVDFEDSVEGKLTYDEDDDEPDSLEAEAGSFEDDTQKMLAAGKDLGMDGEARKRREREQDVWNTERRGVLAARLEGLQVQREEEVDELAEDENRYEDGGEMGAAGNGSGNESQDGDEGQSMDDMDAEPAKAERESEEAPEEEEELEEPGGRWFGKGSDIESDVDDEDEDQDAGDSLYRLAAHLEGCSCAWCKKHKVAAKEKAPQAERAQQKEKGKRKEVLPRAAYGTDGRDGTGMDKRRSGRLSNDESRTDAGDRASSSKHKELSREAQARRMARRRRREQGHVSDTEGEPSGDDDDPRERTIVEQPRQRQPSPGMKTTRSAGSALAGCHARAQALVPAPAQPESEPVEQGEDGPRGDDMWQRQSSHSSPIATVYNFAWVRTDNGPVELVPGQYASGGSKLPDVPAAQSSGEGFKILPPSLEDRRELDLPASQEQSHREMEKKDASPDQPLAQGSSSGVSADDGGERLQGQMRLSEPGGTLQHHLAGLLELGPTQTQGQSQSQPPRQSQDELAPQPSPAQDAAPEASEHGEPVSEGQGNHGMEGQELGMSDVKDGSTFAGSPKNDSPASGSSSSSKKRKRASESERDLAPVGDVALEGLISESQWDWEGFLRDYDSESQSCKRAKTSPKKQESPPQSLETLPTKQAGTGESRSMVGNATVPKISRHRIEIEVGQLSPLHKPSAPSAAIRLARDKPRARKPALLSAASPEELGVDNELESRSRSSSQAAPPRPERNSRVATSNVTQRDRDVMAREGIVGYKVDTSQEGETTLMPIVKLRVIGADGWPVEMLAASAASPGPKKRGPRLSDDSGFGGSPCQRDVDADEDLEMTEHGSSSDESETDAVERELEKLGERRQPLTRYNLDHLEGFRVDALSGSIKGLKEFSCDTTHLKHSQALHSVAAGSENSNPDAHPAEGYPYIVDDDPNAGFGGGKIGVLQPGMGLGIWDVGILSNCGMEGGWRMRSVERR